MDIADKAQEDIDTHLEGLLRNRKTITIPFSGFCLSCQEPVEGKRRFCDKECSTDWEHEKKKKFGVTHPTP